MSGLQHTDGAMSSKSNLCESIRELRGAQGYGKRGVPQGTLDDIFLVALPFAGA
jgi:hypothetical protein